MSVRRFVLADLTPATRALYIAYRNACAAVRRANTAMDTALAAQIHRSTDLHHLTENPAAYTDEARERIIAMRDQTTAAYKAAAEAFDTAVQAATDAFWAAVPAMEAEGYPRQWFNTPTGAMVIPAGQSSPGANRPGRTSKLGIGDRVDIKAGDERGGWGSVERIDGRTIHVGLYGSRTDVREYDRSEVRKIS
jgi:hypothetical protein